MKKAFTLIELLVSISIIVVLSLLVLGNFRVSNDFYSLSSFKSNLENDLILLRSNSLNFVHYKEELPYSWGIHLKKGDDFYTIFADLDNNLIPSEDEILKISKIPSNSNLTISNISLADEVSIIFPIEEGFSFFYNAVDGFEYEGELFIELSDSDFKMGKIINVNSFSKIDTFPCFCNSEVDYCCSFCPDNLNCLIYE